MIFCFVRETKQLTLEELDRMLPLPLPLPHSLPLSPPLGLSSLGAVHLVAWAVC